MSDSPMFSIVTVTWNAGDEILRSLDSIYAQTVDDFEVVIADNDSDDDTVTLIRDAYGDEPTLTLLENDRNLGFSAGINRAIKRTEGDYICCYNQDTLFPSDYLAELEKKVTQDAAWTTARVNYRVSETHQCIRFRTKYGYSIPYVVDSRSGCVETNFIPGDGAIIPRAIYNDVLKNMVFDPTLPARGEDVDLGLRLQEADITIKAILDTYSIHPDKLDLYETRIVNFDDFLMNLYSNVVAYQRRNSASEWLPVLLGGFLLPFEVYFDQFPRPEKRLSEVKR
ncbi:glycosyltransferase family 2 protein [Natrialbaceae archaeon GCM10025810]|uniref:glycosyltransferase family 2 protein n=1 Tax=Halovalidus salilacus TaxID=3075124 RepID=UPI00361582D2